MKKFVKKAMAKQINGKQLKMCCHSLIWEIPGTQISKTLRELLTNLDAILRITKSKPFSTNMTKTTMEN